MIPPFHILFSTFSTAFPFIAGLFVYKRLSKELRFLMLFFTGNVVFDLIFSYLAINNIRNLWLFHIYTVFEYGFWIYFFSFLLKNELVRSILRISIPIFILFWFSVKLLWEEWFFFNTVTRPLNSLILIMVSLYTLHQFNKENIYSLFREPRFWIIVGVLVYFSGNILLFSMTNIVLESHPGVWLLHSILNILANLCFTRGLLCTRPVKG